MPYIDDWTSLYSYQFSLLKQFNTMYEIKYKMLRFLNIIYLSYQTLNNGKY